MVYVSPLGSGGAACANVARNTKLRQVIKQLPSVSCNHAHSHQQALGRQRGHAPVPGCRPTRRYAVRTGGGSVGIAGDLAPSDLLRAAINLGNPVLAPGDFGQLLGHHAHQVGQSEAAEELKKGDRYNRATGAWSESKSRAA
jgi:hypothetical protein